MQTKEVQGQLWSTAPADWSKLLEPTFIPMYQAVLELLSLNEEKMLLDVGCGSGLFLSMASITGAEVHGIDAAPGLLAISKERLPRTPLLLEDLEALPFIDGSFDVVTAFNSLQYAGNFLNALAEAARVVKKHGKLVIGIWGKEENCETASVHRAILSLLPEPPAGTPDTFALIEDGVIENYCASVGLRVLIKQNAFCPWQFKGDDELTQAFLCTAPGVKAVQHNNLDLVKSTIIKSSQPFNMADDVYYMRNHLTYFITEKL